MDNRLTRILIVDDSELVRRAVAGLLASEPSWIVCGEASDGAEAIQKAQIERPDVILLDISMPGAGGLEVAGRLRQELPASAILIMSQHDASLLSASAAQVGANGCVDKSNLPTELLVVIRRVLSSSQSGRTP